MPILQLLLTIFIFMSFFVALLIIAWYIAIPLLLIWLLLGGIKWIQMRLMEYRLNRQAKGCTIRRTTRKFRDKATVIDVDYTELN